MPQVRYDEKRGIYRDCKWCGGKGCLSCPAEAEKEYKRQFPDGPQPVIEVPNSPEGIEQLRTFLTDEGVLPLIKQNQKTRIERIALDLRNCAEGWEASACLLGNVTAEEMRDLCQWVEEKVNAQATMYPVHLETCASDEE